MSDLSSFEFENGNKKFNRKLSETTDRFVSGGFLSVPWASFESHSKKQVSRRELEENLLESNKFFATITEQSLINDFFEFHIFPKGYLATIEHSSLVRDFSPQSSSRDTSRYILVAEFAITALIACAAVARIRQDSVESFEGIESLAYGNPSILESQEDFVVAKINEETVALSGSITDYMFSQAKQRPTFILGLNDTLVSIAEAIFHDGKLGYLIAELNRDKTIQYEKDGLFYVEISSRSILCLPVYEDIGRFRLRDLDSLIPGRLITVVNQNVLDKELVEEELRSVFVPSSISSNWPALRSRTFTLSCGRGINISNLLISIPKDSRVRLNSIVTSGIKVIRSVDL